MLKEYYLGYLDKSVAVKTTTSTPIKSSPPKKEEQTSLLPCRSSFLYVVPTQSTNTSFWFLLERIPNVSLWSLPLRVDVPNWIDNGWTVESCLLSKNHECHYVLRKED